jgi:hypothetical protein
MKFESKLGIGEIVENSEYKNGELIASELYKIIAITFDGIDKPIIHCRHPTSGMNVAFKENELLGDPDYDQSTGRYVGK